LDLIPLDELQVLLSIEGVEKGLLVLEERLDPNLLHLGPLSLWVKARWAKASETARFLALGNGVLQPNIAFLSRFASFCCSLRSAVLMPASSFSVRTVAVKPSSCKY
jgi:hypothetical protein